MHRILLVALVAIPTVLSSATFAQDRDEERRLSYVRPQEAVKHVEELFNCAVIFGLAKLNLDTLWETYYRMATKATVQIEDHIQKYRNTRDQKESLEAFKFRIWSVAVVAGKGKARSVKELDIPSCSSLISQL